MEKEGFRGGITVQESSSAIQKFSLLFSNLHYFFKKWRNKILHSEGGKEMHSFRHRPSLPRTRSGPSTAPEAFGTSSKSLTWAWGLESEIMACTMQARAERSRHWSCWSKWLLKQANVCKEFQWISILQQYRLQRGDELQAARAH